jgi:hypothetical protein
MEEAWGFWILIKRRETDQRDSWRDENDKKKLHTDEHKSKAVL